MFRKPLLTYKLFAWLFFTTGVFATIGSLFSWGKGWLFTQTNLNNVLLPLSDLLVTSPLSFISAYGIWYKKNWGIFAGLLTSGIYIFGSVVVYVSIIWNGSPYPIQLIVPPIFGLSFAALFFIWVINTHLANQSSFFNQE